ncbi:Suppressor of G2 allele of SKP1 [Binucleata daphniae]
MSRILFHCKDTKNKLKLQFLLPVCDITLQKDKNTFTCNLFDIRFANTIIDMSVDTNQYPNVYKFTKEKPEYWTNIGEVINKLANENDAYKFTNESETTNVQNKSIEMKVKNEDTTNKDCVNDKNSTTIQKNSERCGDSKIIRIKNCVEIVEKHVKFDDCKQKNGINKQISEKNTMQNNTKMDKTNNAMPQQTFYNPKYDEYFADEPDNESDDKSIEALLYMFYKNASDDAKRAMNKSYIESNGTVLTSCWSDVSNKKVNQIHNEAKITPSNKYENEHVCGNKKNNENVKTDGKK